MTLTTYGDIAYLTIGPSDDWLAIDESLSENLIGIPQDDDSEESSLSSGNAGLSVTSSSRSGQVDGRSPGSYRYACTDSHFKGISLP